MEIKMDSMLPPGASENDSYFDDGEMYPAIRLPKVERACPICAKVYKVAEWVADIITRDGCSECFHAKRSKPDAGSEQAAA